MDDTTARITKIIVEHLGVEASQVTPDTPLEELGADSLDCVELMMVFEEEFDCEIPDETIPEQSKMITVQQVIDIVDKCRGAA